MSNVGVSANRLEIMQIAKAVAEEKAIDRAIVIEAMQEAIEKAAKSRYGQEHDIRALIDHETGEQRLWRIQTVVDPEEIEDPAQQISLADAKKIDASLELGDEIKEELPPFDFGLAQMSYNLWYFHCPGPFHYLFDRCYYRGYQV